MIQQKRLTRLEIFKIHEKKLWKHSAIINLKSSKYIEADFSNFQDIETLETKCVSNWEKCSLFLKTVPYALKNEFLREKRILDESHTWSVLMTEAFFFSPFLSRMQRRNLIYPKWLQDDRSSYSFYRLGISAVALCLMWFMGIFR